MLKKEMEREKHLHILHISDNLNVMKRGIPKISIGHSVIEKAK